ELLRGYSEILRSKLFVNRFRSTFSSTDKVIRHIQNGLKKLGTQWSLTGGPAAYELNHFYRGNEIPVFIDNFSDELARELPLLPDVHGPITVLRPFGALQYWETIGGKPLAHPWLIYSELMYSNDPRAHEAAIDIREKFLNDRVD